MNSAPSIVSFIKIKRYEKNTQFLSDITMNQNDHHENRERLLVLIVLRGKRNKTLKLSVIDRCKTFSYASSMQGSIMQFYLKLILTPNKFFTGRSREIM
ncbi:CLUMA_CG020241, isoform A [Clunio marinus]|uniref:CLUMA_CG020241, isoform A n=1 Tax=Clunio marinus TaxID=568069 RepID=A0A1J1J4C4_9DIPT|nr:CLUMA_CG020241, isoform A [Clunio marinus]